MQRRVFLAGLTGATAAVAGCSAISGGNGGEGGGGTGTIDVQNTDSMPRSVTLSVSGNGTTYLEEKTVNLALSGDNAKRTIENVFEDEPPETATLSVVVGTNDPQTYEWAVSEQSTVQVTVVSGGDVEFGTSE